MMDLSKVVTFKNITGKDFSHGYAGKIYTFLAGEEKILPYDFGRHMAKHLARAILWGGAPLEGQNKPDHDKLYQPEDEEALIGRILGARSTEDVEAVLTESEMITKRIEQLNAKKGQIGKPAEVLPPTATLEDRVKADVIRELEALGASVDKRKSKAALEAELVELKKTLDPISSGLNIGA